MTCEYTKQNLHAFLDGDLSNEERMSIETHLAECADCRDELSDLKEVLQLLKDLPIEPLPEDFEASLHEALERESQQIKSNVTQVNRPIRQQFKKWQRNLSYVAAVFLVGIVGLSGMDMLSSSKESPVASLDQNSYEMSNVVTTGAPLDRMAKSSDGLASAPAEVTFNESLADAPSEEQPLAQYAGQPAEQPVADEPFTPEEIKRIYSGQVNLEVKAYNQTTATLTEKVNSLGGYIESQQSGTYSVLIGGKEVLLNEGFMVLRIPTEHFQSLMMTLPDQGKVLYSASQVSDVTAQYRDTYQEVKNLQVREASLREIMAKAANVTEIIEVERELSRVRQDINNYGSQLANWDRMVALSTIHLTLKEVRDTTTSVNPPEAGLFERAREAFVQTVNLLIEGFDRLFVATVGFLPILLPIVVLAIVSWLGYRKYQKRKV